MNEDFRKELDERVTNASYFVQLTTDSAFGKTGYFLQALYEDCLTVTRTLDLGKIVPKEDVDFSKSTILTKEWLAKCHGEVKSQIKKKFKEQESLRAKAEAEAKKEANAALSFGMIGQAEQFIRMQPVYYDEHKLWWKYDLSKCCWEQTDDTEILNSIRRGLNVDTIDSTTRTEIIESLKQVSREHKPEDLSRDWLQFKNTLVNPKTGEEKKASPKYFMTNVIPFDLIEGETKNIDRLFTEWVGESYAQTLYEICAYSMTRDQFLQRMIALTGGGCNGKGTFVSFLESIMSEENISSSDLSVLSSGRFATSAIYKKLLCIVGEASYDDLKNTNTIKKLTGEDLIQFEFKGKNPFSEKSGCTIVMTTNALPESPDQSTGFYRRWLIIDFPHQFEIKNNVLDCITDDERSAFCKKCVTKLKELYVRQKFTNEGNFEERRVRYEERSRPIEKFVEECYTEDPSAKIELRVFVNHFNVWLKQHNLRMLTARQVGTMLRNHGFNVGQRKIGDKDSSSIVCILSIKKKEIIDNNEKDNHQNHQNHQEGQLKSLIEKRDGGHAGSDGLSGFLEPVVAKEVIHHKCTNCGKTPCGTWIEGKPYCQDCTERMIE
jgi:P4 family phage/plasmid primase-like protien